jgi:hypothetical protein
VPEDHAPGLVDALLHLYQAKAELLHQRANELIRGEGSADALARARQELGALDQTLEQLGWDPGAARRPVEVTADGSVLREATVVAIDEAGEQLSAHCTALLRGEGPATAIEAQIEALRALLQLLRETEGA